MSITTIERNEKKYLYFTVKGTNRLYLGTVDKLKKDRINKAIFHLNEKIKKYENEMNTLKNLLQPIIQDAKIKYKLIVFDLDGVIFDKPWLEDTSGDKVAVSTWDVIFQELHIYDTHERLKQNYIQGKFKTYKEWTNAACTVLKPLLDQKTFKNIINQRPFSQGIREVFQILHKNKIKTAVITGSFDALAQRANEELNGIDDIYAHCKLHFDNTGLLESWELFETDYKDKAKFVKQIMSKHNILKKECVYVGDDVNDIEAFNEVDLSIAFNSNKTKVRQAAKVVIESRDLQSILPHLYEA